MGRRITRWLAGRAIDFFNPNAVHRNYEFLGHEKFRKYLISTRKFSTEFKDDLKEMGMYDELNSYIHFARSEFGIYPVKIITRRPAD